MFSFVNKKKIFFTIPIIIILAGIISFSIFGGFNTDIDFTGGYTMAVDVITEANKIDDGTVVKEEVKEDAAKEESTEATEETAEEVIDVTEAVPQTQNAFETGSKAEGVVTSTKTPLLKSYTYNENEVREVLSAVEGVKVSGVQSSEDGFLLKMNELDRETADKVKTALADKFGQIRITSEEKVAASMGAELWGKSLIAIIIAIILMLVYITIRFELLSGLSAIVALAHDVLIILSIYAIFQLPVNTSFIAAVLTILGYSINATIVIFDRVRENRKFDKKLLFSETVDKSIRQSMTRSINTSVTTLLTIGMVYILGVASVKQFALPIILGVVCGTYSSIFVAGPFWAMIKGDK